MTFGFSVFEKPIHEFTLEEMLTSPRAFGLKTPSNVQRAICRAADGLPPGDVANDPDVVAVFGGESAVYHLPRERPRTILILAAVRGAKSMIAAAAAVRSALSIDLSMLTAGEVPRVSVLSVRVDNAQATFDHIKGHIEAAPDLAKLIIGKPKTSSLMLRHPTGRPIEITVVAGGRAANSLQSRWSAGFIADEAPRMLGEEDGVSNLDDATHAILPRLLPGAQSFLIGSPWAPFGPVYEMVQERHGQPGEDVVVIRATGPQMNPFWWTPARCEQLRQEDADAYAVDVLCQFKAPGTTLLDLHQLEECITLEGEQPFNPLLHYVATIDPATRGNGWTLTLMTNTGGGAIQVVLAREWVGSSSRPLSPRATFQEIAELLKPYNVTTLHSDHWSGDANKDLAREFGLYLFLHTVQMVDKVTQCDRLKGLVTEKKFAMARVPLMVRDLGNVRKRVTQTAVAIEYPVTPDGRHCDYAAALVLGLMQNLPEPNAPPKEIPYADQRKAELSRIIGKANRRRGLIMPD